MVYNTNEVQFVEFDVAQELWQAEMQASRFRVRFVSAIKEGVRELVVGPRRSGARETSLAKSGKDTVHHDTLQQNLEPPKGTGLDMMFTPAGSMAVPCNVSKPDLRPISWMFIKPAPRVVRFAAGDDLETVVIIPYEEEYDAFVDDYADYYMDDEDESDEEEVVVAVVDEEDMTAEEKKACDFDRLVGFAGDAVRRRRGVGAERMWVAAQC
ncbi:unnamed protein product [Peniophora sp. CBMAI 1063]|nr:unnamed protein product [Peniophora sp. CBMAI 1063]